MNIYVHVYTQFIYTHINSRAKYLPLQRQEPLSALINACELRAFPFWLTGTGVILGPVCSLGNIQPNTFGLCISEPLIVNVLFSTLLNT